MGMASSDDEGKIAEDHALLEWAREAPKQPWGWDERPTEEQRIAYDEAVKRHHEKRPKTRDPWRNDRR